MQNLTFLWISMLGTLFFAMPVFAEEKTSEAEDIIGKQMVVQATVIAHLVSIAEKAGLSPEAINAHLRAITEKTILSEIWVTDEKGHAYLTNMTGIDFTFSPDAKKQPQASVFWQLISGEKSVVIQKAQKRELDDQIFKYAGVAGVDKPRIVQVGYQADILK